MKKILYTAFCFFLFILKIPFTYAVDTPIFLMPPDGWPSTNWTISTAYGSPVITNTNLQGENWLEIARTSGNTGSGQVIYTGEGNQWAFLSGSVIFGISAPSSTYGGGVILRSAGTSFAETNAYYLTIRYDSTLSASVLELRWGVGSDWTVNAPLLASAALPISLGRVTTTNSQYLLDFSFVGDTLNANVWAWHPTNNVKGTNLASLSYTDTNNLSSEGYVGLRGGRYGGNSEYYFRDLNIFPGYASVISSSNTQFWSNTNDWTPAGLPTVDGDVWIWGASGSSVNQTFRIDDDHAVANLTLGGNEGSGFLRLIGGNNGDSNSLTVTDTLTVANHSVALSSVSTNYTFIVNTTNLMVDTGENARILSLGLDDGRVNLEVAGVTVVGSGAIHIARGDQKINLGHLSLVTNSLLLSGTNFSSVGGTNYSVQVRSLSGNVGSTISNDYAAQTTLEILGENTSVATYSGTISNGAGVVALAKQGSGTQVLARHNTFTGATTLAGGVLELKSTNGPALGATASLTIASSATLLISESNQINNTNTTVTLSGGTIRRAGGVSETFGDLNLTVSSTLDFGSGTKGTLNFGNYTPSALLTVNNFFKDNVLTFKSDLTSTISNNAYFSFSGTFTSGWDGDSGIFTIIAIPEPSSMTGAAALLGLMLWPMGRRLAQSRRSLRHHLRLPS